jgi:hypothetical protein
MSGTLRNSKISNIAKLRYIKADMEKAKAKFQEWCTESGPPGSGIFYFDFALFGGTVHKHVF